MVFNRLFIRKISPLLSPAAFIGSTALANYYIGKMPDEFDRVGGLYTTSSNSDYKAITHILGLHPRRGLNQQLMQNDLLSIAGILQFFLVINFTTKYTIMMISLMGSLFSIAAYKKNSDIKNANQYSILKFGENREGWSLLEAYKNRTRRYQELTNNTHLPLNVVASYAQTISKEDFLKKISTFKHGDYIAITTILNLDNTGHVVSFHLLAEDDKVHLIYFNRGANRKSEVYTLPNSFCLQTADKLYDFCKISPNPLQENIELFLNEIEFNFQKNTDLTKTLTKSFQIMGNCTTASLNISWHLAIAAEKLKWDFNRQSALNIARGRRLTFSEAFESSTSTYKKLRALDRAQAFVEFLGNKEIRAIYQDDKAYYQDLLRIMQKLASKEVNSYEHSAINPVLEALAKANLLIEFNEIIQSLELRKLADYLFPIKHENIYTIDALDKWQSCVLEFIASSAAKLRP